MNSSDFNLILPGGGLSNTDLWLTVGIKEWSGMIIKRAETNKNDHLSLK